MAKHFLRYGLIVLAGFIPFLSLAADAPSGLTRVQAVRLALENNPQLQAAARRLEAARARRLQADGFEPPTVFWDVEEADGGGPRRFGNQIYGIEQTVEWFSVRRARKQATGLGIEAATASLDRVRLRITAQTQKTFDQVLLADNTVRLLQQLVVLTGEAVGISRVRFKSGTGKYVDLLRTRIARQRLQNDLRDAKIAAAKARRLLGVLLGNDAGTLTVLGELRYQSLQLDRDAWLAKISQTGPTFILLKRRAEQADKVYAATRKARLPEVTVGLGRQRMYDGANTNYAWAGQLGLKFPLPGSDRQRGLEGEALAEAQAIQDRGHALRLRARARLWQRYDEAEALAAQLTSYNDAILPDSEDQLKAAQQEYRVRRIDALNLLDVYNTYLDTHRTYLNTLTRYRAALADLETLGEDLWEVEL